MDKTQILKDKIKKLREQNGLLLTVLTAAQLIDGQRLTKRFSAAVEAINPRIWVKVTKDGSVHDLEVCYMGGIGADSIVRIYNLERAEILVNNHFVYKTFEDWISSVIQSNDAEILQINEDIKTGQERLQRYIELQRQAREVMEGFSFTFKHTYDYELHRRY